MSNETKIFYATGRRKSSAARVFMKPGKGEVIINDQKMDEYLKQKSSILYISEPFEITKTAGRLDLNVTVTGGGETGQSGAIRLGIARALCAYDEALRKPLKAAGMLTRDSRMVERKKYGLHGARRRTQFSKR